MNTPDYPVNYDLGEATAKAKPCGACNGSGYEDYMIYVGFDYNGDVGQRTCANCQGFGIEALAITIPAPTIKPVKKRKTGKMYTRNPMLNANDHDHWRVQAPIKKEWRRRGRGYGNALRLRDLHLEHARIDYYVNKPTAGRSDAGNFYPTAKHIIDGLIDAGLLPDDNDNYLDGPFPHQGNKAPYSMTIVITL